MTSSIFCAVAALLGGSCNDDDILNLRGRVNTIEAEIEEMGGGAVADDLY